MSEIAPTYSPTLPRAYKLLKDWPITYMHGGMNLIATGTVLHQVDSQPYYTSDGLGIYVTHAVASAFPEWFKPILQDNANI